MNGAAKSVVRLRNALVAFAVTAALVMFAPLGGGAAYAAGDGGPDAALGIQAAKLTTQVTRPTVKLTWKSAKYVKSYGRYRVELVWSPVAYNTWYTGCFTQYYEVQYSTKKNFSSSKRSKSVNARSANHDEISGLKANTKYYFRVRFVRGDVNGKLYPGPWSSTKAVKTSAAKKKSGSSGASTSKPASKYQPTQKLKLTATGSVAHKISTQWTYASKWYDNSTVKSHYELQWSGDSSFKYPFSKSVFVRQFNSLSLYLAGYTRGGTELYGKGKWYFRVRLVNTTSAGNYYGPWSAKKAATVS